MVKVRGAPAIAIVGCLSLAVELYDKTFKTLLDLQDFVVERLDYLVTSRPTAVNMADAAYHFKAFIKTLAAETNEDPHEGKNMRVI